MADHPRSNRFTGLTRGHFHRSFAVALLLAGSLMATASFARDGGKADKSGTNPISFTNDLRLYYEYQDLSSGGDMRIGNFEGRTPAFDRKLQFRVRAPYKAIVTSVNQVSDDEPDLGDINARVLAVPYLNMENGTALAVGLEAFFPTAGRNLPERLEDWIGDDTPVQVIESLSMSPISVDSGLIPLRAAPSTVSSGRRHLPAMRRTESRTYPAKSESQLYNSNVS